MSNERVVWQEDAYDEECDAIALEDADELYLDMAWPFRGIPEGKRERIDIESNLQHRYMSGPYQYSHGHG